ncbi:hypothetical protein DSUL_140089 [Desulfovibrionales bacterium]
MRAYLRPRREETVFYRDMASCLLVIDYFVTILLLWRVG